MKTILNLIITTFGVLFILSACGGGGGDFTVGFEERTCTNDPFSDDCGPTGTGTRTRIIKECLEKGETCKDTTPEVETCLTDLFSAECAAVADTAFVRTTVTIAELRETFCNANKANANCQTTPTVMETCTSDPFDSDCGATYNTNRETSCRANNTSACAATITRFCVTDAVGTPANLFDTLCATYDTARENACRDTPTGLDCASTITRFCETDAPANPTNIFNPLCATYNTARENACRGNTAGLDCTSTIVQYCETDATPDNGNTLNSLCVDVKYNTPREAACRTSNHDSLCPATITRYCETEPTTAKNFNSLCSANTVATLARNLHCMDTDNAFTDNCIDSGNMEGMTARDNFCKDITNDYANAFTDNCINSNNMEGMTARDNFCADKSNNYRNPLSAKCIDSNNAEGIAPRNEFCGDTANNRANAFNPACRDNSEGIASRRIVNGDCSDGYNAFTADCRVAWEADLCIRYPFGRMQVGDPGSTDALKRPTIDLQCDPVTYATEREKRYDFCVNDTARDPGQHEFACFEISREICFLDGRSPTVENFNPFARICQLNNYGDHKSILTACSIGNTYNLRGDVCSRSDNYGRANGDIICSKNPFSVNADCRVFVGQVRSQPLVQANRLLFCRGGNANPADNLDINDPAQLALCVVDGDTSADSVLCRATGEHSNPFAPLCLASGSQFAANRITFAGYCKNNNVAALDDAVCPPDVTRCVGDPFHVDCINEAAYADFRQPNVDRCEGLGTDASSDSDCTETIIGCLADPYSVDCRDNRDYENVRMTLNTNCVINGQGGDTRCSLIAGQVCGANPFADTCDKGTYSEQQKNLANQCLGPTYSSLCAGRVDDCNDDPFNPDLGDYNCETNAAFVRARQFYCVENPSGGGAQTISSADCKAFAKLGGNECVRNPYGAGCLAVFFGSGRLSEAQANRLSYCESGGGSVAIRGDEDEEALCRGAIDATCIGDKSFDTTGLECFNDSGYQTARNTHLANCQKAASARARVECEFTADQICQSTESIYTNPFLSVCDDGDADSLIARQTVITACQMLNTSQREDQERCETNEAFEILNDCDDDPFLAKCNDYSGTEQAYFTPREQRITDCGLGTGENRCSGTLSTICTSDTAKSAPFAPACDNEMGIKATRNAFLQACDGGGSVLNCSATIAMNVKGECDADPYDSAVATAGNSMVSCLDFGAYDTPRSTRLSNCLAGTADGLNCQGPIARTCIPTGAPFNPFLCKPTTILAHARAQRDYCQIRANVGPASGAVTESACEAFLGAPTTATLLRAQTTELRATPDKNARINAFLKGTDTGLDASGFVQADNTPSQVAAINMELATYEGVPLGGDAADGIAFFAGRPANRFTRVDYYAGILAGADLGAVLRQESTGATAKWYGAVNWAILNGDSKGFLYQSGTSTDRATRDFVLTVNLDTRYFSSLFGLGDTFDNGDQGFELTGNYDATTGVITGGQVYFGVKAGNRIARRGEGGITYHFDGPLIGIIGAEGALGVFHAQRDDNAQGEGLSGGFVAAPPRGDYLSWARATDALATAGVGDSTTNYIRGGTEALDRGGAGALDFGGAGISYTLTLADEYSLEGVDHRIVTLGGQVADGVSLAVNEFNGDRLYSGLLSGTDVGAPLVANAQYQGRIAILIRKDGKTTYDVAHDFTLNASFGAGSFTSLGATFDEGIFQIMSGRFNQFGLISGTVRLTTLTGNSSGTLSGLIGAEGVVGSFISTIHTDGAFAGGFVARADVTSTPPNLRDTAAWQTGAVRADGTTSLTILDTTAEIEGTQGTLRAANFYQHGTSFGSVTNPQTETLHLGSYIDALGDSYSLGGDATDGVTFTSATVSSATRHYVGLLSTTSLGNPVSHTDPRATWIGRFALINASLKGDNAYTADFALIVNFRDRSISSPDIAIPFALLDDGVADELNISGRYDGHGLIRGTVIYKNNGGAGAVTTTSGYLSGLIGERGAIGAFVSDTAGANDAYAGGFVAVPIDNRALLATGPVTPLRLKGFASLPNFPNQLTTTPSGFLKPASGQNELTLNNFFVRPDAEGPQALDTNSAANHIGRRGGVGSTDDDGYHYFHTYSMGDDRGYGYGGILSTTNLGAPLANSGVAAVWTGYFSHYSDITDRNADFYIDFVAGTVGFANATGDGVADKTFADNLGGSDDFRLEGQFGSPHNLATGQLGGTVSRINAGPNDSYDILGLIGVEGAVAVFINFDRHNAGGFTASNPSDGSYCTIDPGACRVNHADWVNRFAIPPPTKLDPANQRNQFLAGGQQQLNTEDAINAQQHTISASTSLASFDGVDLGLGHNHGVSYFGDNDDKWYFYAGVLSETDLGAPVGTTFGGQATGRWNGKFGYVAPRGGRTDFTLEIDFANSRIEAFVLGRDGNHFHVKGSYDVSGAITNGTVDYGAFTANTRTPKATRTPNGVLTGIIGVEGAVGAFISDVTGSAGYAGGFIAVPNAVLGADTVAVNYNDWIRSFNARPSIYLDTDTRVSQFLASHSGATALDSTGSGTVNAVNKGSLNLATATFKGEALGGGEATDGVSWFWDSTNTRGYAGILSGTDLGAPLSQTGTAKWHGQFQATGGLSRDFLLEIDFTNSMIEALVYHTGASYYHITGSFGANGVITGEVNYGTFSDLIARTPMDSRADNGILTGLIGAQGAVGAFISGTGNKNTIIASDPVVHYAGGFVATPTNALDDNLVNYDDWARSFITLPPNQVDPTPIPPARISQFLGTTTGATVLDTGGTSGTIQKGRLDLGSSYRDVNFAADAPDANDGVSFFWQNNATAGYAGILAGTDLGGLLTQGSGDAKVKWNGQFQALINTVNRSFVLTINFADSNAIEAFVQQAGDNYYHLTGNFDDKGVITGEVNYGTFNGTDTETPTPTANRAPNGFLTGLIGEDGAVGAFLSGTGTKDAIISAAPVYYAGGFVAKSGIENTGNDAKFSNWADAVSPLPAPTTSGAGGDFVRGTATYLPIGGRLSSSIQNRGTLSLTDTLDGLAPTSGTNHGVGFFRTNNYFAAGLLSGTDLGAPLSNNAQAGEWAGRIIGFSNRHPFPVISGKPFTLTVTFDGGSGVQGSISAFVRDDSPFIVSNPSPFYYKIDGTYDSKGVISGKVTVAKFAGNAASGAITSPIVPNSANSLTGLIGERGAVGAFQSYYSDGSSTRQYGFVGGFIACKRDSTGNACE
ncbi:MAG: hypothetical protein ACNYPD_01845 [Candidatus Halichondribacter symbioticus]